MANRINLQSIKERGKFIAHIEGFGYVYQLNNCMYRIGSHGFNKM